MIATGTIRIELSRLRQFASRTRSRLLSTTARWRRAWRYAAGTWTENDAFTIAFEAHDRAGYWPLETIDVEGLEGLAQDKWGDVPELAALAQSAAARVARKWDSSGDQRSAAMDWALDLIEQYAKEDGVDLPEPQW